MQNFLVDPKTGTPASTGNMPSPPVPGGPPAPSGPQNFLVKPVTSKETGAVVAPEAAWSYKNPSRTGPAGEKLPDGAKGWKPDGKPYYGGGFDGWWRGKTADFGKASDPVKKEEWAGAWDNLIATFGPKKTTEASTPEHKGPGTSGFVKDVVQSSVKEISAVVQFATLFGRTIDSTGEGSVVQPLIRAEKAWIGTLLEGLQMGGIGLERAAGTALLLPYSFNPNNKADAAWQASRMLYTYLIEPEKVQIYIDRYNDGEDAALLAAELQNPWAEMIGQMALDPLNWIGPALKGISKATVVAESASYYKPAETISVAIDALRTAPNQERALELYDDLDNVLVKVGGDIETGLAQTHSYISTISTGNQEIAGRTMATTLSLVATDTFRSDGGISDVVDNLRSVFLMASKDKGDRMTALAQIFDATKGTIQNPEMYLSRPFQEAGIIMRNLMTNPDGAVDVESFLKKLAAVGDDNEKMIDVLTKMVDKSVEAFYPTITEMRKASELAAKGAETGGKVGPATERLAKMYDDLSSGVKRFARLAEGPEKAKGKTNYILGSFYFSQPGVSVRNFMQDTFAILTDVGPGAYGTSTAGALEYVDKWLGFRARATGGFSTGVGGMEGKTFLSDVASAVTAGASGKSALMSKVERSSAAHVFYGSFRENITKLVDAIFKSHAEEFRSAGVPDAIVTALKSEVMDNGGDVLKAIDTVRTMHGGESIKSWRLLQFIPDKQIRVYKKMGWYDDLKRLAREDAPMKDVQAFFKQKMTELESLASKSVNDPTDISKSNPAYQTVMDMAADEADAGIHGDALMGLKANLEAASQAQRAANDAIQSIFEKALRDPNIPDEAKDALSGLRRSYIDSLETSRGLAVSSADEITLTTNRLVKESRNSKFPSMSELQDLWDEAKIPGVMPVDMNRDEIINSLYKYARERKSLLWENHFDKYSDATKLVEQMKLMGLDTSGAAGMLEKSTALSATAQKMRSTYFKGGWLWGEVIDDVGKVVEDMATAGQSAESMVMYVSGRLGALDWIKRDMPWDATTKRVLATINKYMPEGSKFKDFEEIKNSNKMDDVIAALSNRAEAKGFLRRTTVEEDTSQAMKQFMARKAFLEKEIADANAISKANGGWGTGKMPDGREITEVLAKNVDELKKLDGDIATESLRGAASTFTATPEGAIDAAKALTTEIKAWDTGKVVIDVSESNGKLAIKLIKTVGTDASGKGEASKILDKMVAAADKAGVDVELYAAKMGEGGLNQADLTAWYQRHGFVIEGADSNLMIHQPATGTLVGKVAPPHVGENQPTLPRGYLDNQAGLKEMLQQHMDAAKGLEGKSTRTLYNVEMEQKLKDMANSKILPKVAEARAIAAKTAEHWRDFSMHLYGKKTYMDLALSYVLPYHFWYGRTYAKWLKRLTTDPQVIAAYAKYKHAMEQSNAEAPEWWKYNVDVTKLLGIETEHPLFINLEQSLWPLNGLTGVDFNDPYKRINWWTSSLDDVGKFGPSLWAPIQMAVAVALQFQGEKEASSRWGGTLIPQTAVLKSALALAGEKIPALKPGNLPGKGEYDPAVWMFSGGINPYERAQIGRALGSMIGTTFQGQVVTKEAADEAARAQKGPMWDEAQQQALVLRAPGKLLSYFAGVGLKPRTIEDMQIDKFYSEYRVLRSSWDILSPEARRTGMDNLRSKYQFMDTVLIARKGSEDRDNAYAYNVLSRIPPGQATELLSGMGLTQAMIDGFYNQGTAGAPVMTQPEMDTFMGNISQLGALLKLPDTATQSEWTTVKNRYQQFRDNADKMFGVGVWDRVTEYYDLYYTDRAKAEQYINANPEVNDAIMARQAIKITDPLIFKYYGSLDSLFSYYDGWVMQKLGEKYGNVSQQWQDYYDAQIINPRVRLPSNLKAYSAEKKVLQAQVDVIIKDLAKHLPIGEELFQFRGDIGTPSATQQQLMTTMNPQPITWKQWQQVLSPPLQNLVRAYAESNIPLSTNASSQLAYAAQSLGIYDARQALQMVVLALRTP